MSSLPDDQELIQLIGMIRDKIQYHESKSAAFSKILEGLIELEPSEKPAPKRPTLLLSNVAHLGGRS
jgi:hypothetical protein